MIRAKRPAERAHNSDIVHHLSGFLARSGTTDTRFVPVFLPAFDRARFSLLAFLDISVLDRHFGNPSAVIPRPAVYIVPLYPRNYWTL